MPWWYRNSFRITGPLRGNLPLTGGLTHNETTLQQCSDVLMSAMTSQITYQTSVYSTVNSSADQRKHISSASLAFVRRIHRGPVNSTHKISDVKNVSIWWRHHESFDICVAARWSKQLNTQSSFEWRQHDVTPMKNTAPFFYQYWSYGWFQ